MSFFAWIVFIVVAVGMAMGMAAVETQPKYKRLISTATLAVVFFILLYTESSNYYRGIPKPGAYVVRSCVKYSDVYFVVATKVDDQKPWRWYTLPVDNTRLENGDDKLSVWKQGSKKLCLLSYSKPIPKVETNLLPTPSGEKNRE